MAKAPDWDHLEGGVIDTSELVFEHTLTVDLDGDRYREFVDMAAANETCCEGRLDMTFVRPPTFYVRRRLAPLVRYRRLRRLTGVRFAAPCTIELSLPRVEFAGITS